MKKFISFAILAATLSISLVSCSKDDDSSDSNTACTTCTISSIATQVCDNGDGTVTYTINGIENTQQIDYTTAIAALQASGAVCE